MLRFRKHDWLNLKTLSTVYGVQANTGKGKWVNCSKSGKPLFFDTAKERTAWIKAQHAALEMARQVALCDQDAPSLVPNTAVKGE
ncbi:MAG: hypothetical protein COB36_11435 [Alphaproteobacteria bacterium]|nr:MAG: hypothetical protein COB36_11435 [Alphaproteobacteria bacterium]